MPILSGLVIAITGTLPAEPVNIKKWVEANGGKWSARVEKGVTHLITSKEAWIKVTDPVRDAYQFDIHVVSYDWLEDSLQRRWRLAEKKYTWEAIKKDRKERRKFQKMGIKADSKKFTEGCTEIRELTGSGKSTYPLRKPKTSKSFFFASAINTPFVSASEALMQRRAEREAAEAAEKAAKSAKAAKKASSVDTAQAPIEIEDETLASHATSTMLTAPLSISPTQVASPSPSTPATSSSTINEPQTKRFVLKDYYHYYLDSTGFEYKVTLARSYFAQNEIFRYHISILESHITPHTYCTFIRYVPPLSVDVTSNTPDASDANIRNPLLRFLNRSIVEPNKASAPTHIATMNHTMPDPTEATRLRALITPSQEPSIDRTELARLHSLITPALPSRKSPYKTLVCPMNSSFPAAWRAFRHVFRDLTLLSWEERFDTGKAIQRSRAQVLNIEPYIYSKPPMGTPSGLQVQEDRLYHGHVGDMFIAGDGEDGYIRNAFKLPGIDEELGRYGVIGSAIWREEEEVRRKEEARREKIEEKERRAREAMRVKNNAEHKKPLYNGVMGRPQPSLADGQMRGGGAYGAAVKKSRPFSMAERR
ncbi:hypothetical protein DE146DRAFT_294778 [Phaeosphaeria sp. MPI-PUGE-AT-0046c]|nr:hypothetical protein DE146DRAFT_294778 [Phaeosphaeria sp. MPI-PUGE-AT-0046c]